MPKFKKNPSPIMKKQGYGKAKSPFTMKGSPFKQAIGGDAGEAIAHHQKYKKNKAWKKSFDKWMTGVIKRGGTTKSVISDVAKKSGKFLGKTRLLSHPAVLAASMMFGKTSKADQPVVKTKKMSEKSMKSVQTAISKQMNPLKP